MTDILPFLKSLISVAGLSAYEEPVVQLIRTEWAPLADEISASRLGSLHALKRGTRSASSAGHHGRHAHGRHRPDGIQDS